MDLDIRTLSVIVAIAYILQTLAITFLYLKNKKYDGVEWWAIGSTATAIGFILFLVRDFNQIALISIILPNALVVLGSVFIYIGILHFLERRENRGLVFLVFALFIVLYFYFTYVNDDINARTVIVSLVIAFYWFLTALELVGNTPRAINSSSNFIAVILFSATCFFVFRTLSVLTFAPVENLFTPTLIQTLVFVVYFVAGILLTFGLIIMVNQRLNAEVMDAKDHLMQKNEDLNVAYEDVASKEEELRQNVEEISRTEATLRESEAKYRNLFETMAEGFSIDEIILDETGKPADLRYLRVNPAFERHTGLKAEDIVGKTTLEMFPDAESIWFERYGEVVLTGKPSHFEERFGPLNRWFEVIAYKLENAQFAVIFFDITDRKKAEEALREALSEKEVLLSEIHHRVKNNLTAFISLLSLEGSYEDTEGGRALRKDLQNRARSMALIHETLYRTGKFSKVDMDLYLKNLVNQIAISYGKSARIQTIVHVRDETLDIDRATTAGLIINELVTNSFKYAFPPDFDCMAVRGEPCTIQVSFYNEGGKQILSVADNGCGLPEGFDPLTSKSLGLKLVNFLARHQLRADIEVRSDEGTEFIFCLKNTDEEP